MARAAFTIFDGPNFFFYCGKLFFGGAGGEDVAAVFGEAGKNSGDLRRRLAFAENDFGHADAQGAVMIDLGEAEIFEGQMTQARNGVVGRELALAYLFEKLADGFGVQEALSIQHSAFSQARS